VRKKRRRMADRYVTIKQALVMANVSKPRLTAAIKNGTIATIPNENDKRSKLVKLSDVEQLELRRCSRCHKRQSILLFHRESGGGRAKICKTCKNKQTKRNDLARRYGISEAQLTQLLQEANNRCTLCGDEETYRQLSIDHNHTTGKIRGILCHRCNIFLWTVKESPERAKLLADKLAEYLTRTN
jgi:DNA-binding MarR family transcriptional regulator